MITTTVPSSSATSYEIVTEGRAIAGLLPPLLDDFSFSFDSTESRVTRSTGEIPTQAHLHGVMAYLTTVGVELISVSPVVQFNQQQPTTRRERNETS